MHVLVAVLGLFLLSPVSVEPPSVPARGKKATIIEIKKPGMYRITATSAEGTACEMVDHIRGPFASSGQSGKRNCHLDLLLDSGRYKLRLRSPKRGRSKVKIDVQPFLELQEKPVRLKRGRHEMQTLHPGQQISYWIKVPERRYTLLRVIGRTAGEVRLWRDGQWVEDIDTRASEFMHNDGQPLYEWQVSGMLEKGNYLFTVYGAKPKNWSKGKARDFVFVANGFEKGPNDGSLLFRIPEWGKVSYEIGKGRMVALMTLDKRSGEDVFLQMRSLTEEKGDHLGSSGGSCRIPKKALAPACPAWSSGEHRNVVTISGSPGTSGQLLWGRYNDGYAMADGDYGRVKNTLAFEAPEDGDYLVAAHDVPVDSDAAPLGCQLSTRSYTMVGDRKHAYQEILGRDFIRLEPEKAFRKKFNYNGREETVWFEIVKGGVFQVATAGEQENRCVLYSMTGDKRQIVHDTDPAATECNIVKHFSPGFYELKLYGGKEGVEHLKMACIIERPYPASVQSVDDTRAVEKSSCLIPRVRLEKKRDYRLELSRSGYVTARGLVLRKLPLKLIRPLPIVIDPGDNISLPTGPGGPVEIRSSGGGRFTCSWGDDYRAKVTDGVCRLPSIGKKKNLLLTNTGDTALSISLHRPAERKAPGKLPAYSPRIPPLPELMLNDPRFFDFERQQSHSMIFDVENPGLYQVTTRGLLSTECRLRTAIVGRLTSSVGGGRGRNCLLSKFLNPGRYLLTVKTVGQSKGRAAVLVTERPVKQGRKVKPGRETFFVVGADELIRQQLRIPRKGKYRIQTSTQMVNLQCRLDDSEGWPLIPVPVRCDHTLWLGKSKYRWTQMPVTVESMRRTQLDRITRPRVLRGNKRHEIGLNQWYRVELGSDGSDEFVFRCSADLNLGIYLESGMQGRLYRLNPGGEDELVEPIPPDRGNVSISVGAGRYKLVTEHSRADVGIRYRLQVSSDVLAPGISKRLNVPSEAVVRLPDAAVLRLKTKGQTDVRCRLFDSGGRLVAESGSHAADWNCLIATPLDAGDFSLVLEAENTIGGQTEVMLVSTDTRDLGILEKGGRFKTSGKVLVARTPEPRTGYLQEFDFRSPLTFSCSLEDENNDILMSREGVRRCPMLINPQGKRYTIRLWSKNWRAKIGATVASRKLKQHSGGRVEREQAALIDVPREGFYETGCGVYCIEKGSSGLLRTCGPEVCLEAGEHIFSATGKKTPQLSMREKVTRLSTGKLEEVVMTRRQHIERQKSKRPSLHLIRVSLPFGEPSSPACSISGGIAQTNNRGCFAVAGPGTESVARWWVTTGRRPEARLSRSAAGIPGKSRALETGVKTIAWSGPVARLNLPDAACRVEMVLPGDAWAVQADKQGALVDFCPPKGELYSCALHGKGGQLYLVSDSRRQTRLRVVLDQRPAASHSLVSVFEKSPRGPGSLELGIQAADLPRTLRVCGAERCSVYLQDGNRQTGCRCTIPPGLGATARIIHGPEPIRAALFTEGRELDAVWGSSLPISTGGVLPPARAEKLQGKVFHRSLALEESALVRMQADSGVCGLAGTGGLLAVEGRGEGCDIQRVLGPGSYHFLVRPFARRPLKGVAVWTAESVEELHEGVGPERWLAPGESRIFKFTTQSAGEVGIGMRVRADILTCTVMDSKHREMGLGCQQLLELEKGNYLLQVASPPFGNPVRFRAVILGLKGSKMQVPEEYLRDFFGRIGEMQ